MIHTNITQTRAAGIIRNLRARAILQLSISTTETGRQLLAAAEPKLGRRKVECTEER